MCMSLSFRQLLEWEVGGRGRKDRCVAVEITTIPRITFSQNTHRLLNERDREYETLDP